MIRTTHSFKRIQTLFSSSILTLLIGNVTLVQSTPQSTLSKRTMHTLKALGVGAGSYLATYYGSQMLGYTHPYIQHIAAATGIVSSLGTYAYLERQYPDIGKTLLKQPVTTLTTMARFKHIFHDALPTHQDVDMHEWVRIYREKASAVEYHCPIFLLSECTHSSCVLSRDNNCHYRANFEQLVSTKLAAATESEKKRATQYVSFGSGKLFQDLVIIARALTEQPHARLDIRLIDSKLRSYIHARDILQLPRSLIDSGTPIDATMLIQTLSQLDTTTETTYTQLQQCIKTERQVHQFLTWLRRSFPQASLTLSLYDSAAQYLEHTHRDRAYPDMLIASDIEDKRCQETHALEEYKALCEAVLLEHPSCANFLLSAQRKKVDIISYECSDDSDALIATSATAIR